MAFDIGAIWVPRIKDTASGLYAQRWIYQGTSSATSTTMNSNPNDVLAQCPVDRARFITFASVALDPGATEIITSLTWKIVVPVVLTTVAEFDCPRDTIVGGQRCSWQTIADVIMFPGEAVQALATIGTATNPKTLFWTFVGYDLPRGNVQ